VSGLRNWAQTLNKLRNPNEILSIKELQDGWS
jgi:hypothetical protein